MNPPTESDVPMSLAKDLIAKGFIVPFGNTTPEEVAQAIRAHPEFVKLERRANILDTSHDLLRKNEQDQLLALLRQAESALEKGLEFIGDRDSCYDEYSNCLASIKAALEGKQ